MSEMERIEQAIQHLLREITKHPEMKTAYLKQIEGMRIAQQAASN